MGPWGVQAHRGMTPAQELPLSLPRRGRCVCHPLASAEQGPRHVSLQESKTGKDGKVTQILLPGTGTP